MFLAEDDLLLRPMQRPPRPDAAFKGAADAVLDIGMTTTQLLEDADGAHARRGLQDRDDLQLPPGLQQIGPPPRSRILLSEGGRDPDKRLPSKTPLGRRRPVGTMSVGRSCKASSGDR